MLGALTAATTGVPSGRVRVFTHSAEWVNREVRASLPGAWICSAAAPATAARQPYRK